MADPLKTVEQLLQKYRPAGPPEGLRERVLSVSAQPAGSQATWRDRAFRWAVAAAILVAVLLNVAAERTAREGMQNVGIGPARWTHDAEQIAQLMGGDERARRYIAAGLMAGPTKRPVPTPREGM